MRGIDPRRSARGTLLHVKQIELDDSDFAKSGAVASPAVRGISSSVAVLSGQVVGVEGSDQVLFGQHPVLNRQWIIWQFVAINFVGVLANHSFADAWGEGFRLVQAFFF